VQMRVLQFLDPWHKGFKKNPLRPLGPALASAGALSLTRESVVNPEQGPREPIHGRVDRSALAICSASHDDPRSAATAHRGG
jgi:hypothetical protein